MNNNDDIQQLKQYILNGDSFMDSGRFQDALQEYDKAIALKPEDRELHYKKGICLVELGFGEGYLEEFERLNPDSTTLHSLKSALLHDMGRDEEAIQACDEAISRNPTNTDLPVSKALLLVSMDNHEAALQVYDAAIDYIEQCVIPLAGSTDETLSESSKLSV